MEFLLIYHFFYLSKNFNSNILFFYFHYISLQQNIYFHHISPFIFLSTLLFLSLLLLLFYQTECKENDTYSKTTKKNWPVVIINYMRKNNRQATNIHH